MKIKYILGIDPSGNFIEGKGTTGLCLVNLTTNKPIWAGYIQACNYNSQEEYWDRVISCIQVVCKQYKGTALAVEDYILYQSTAMSQVNSTFETPQLIGVIKYHCYMNKIPLFIRPASRVKKRWTEDIMVRKGYLKYNKRTGYYIEDEDGNTIQMIEHSRDALKHAIHCMLFEVKENMK